MRPEVSGELQTPVLKGTPQEYMAALGKMTTKVFPINPGDKLEF